MHNPNSRVHGYSLREALINQGVTTEDALKKHLAFVSQTLEIAPALDITRYRANPRDPNSGSPNMG